MSVGVVAGLAVLLSLPGVVGLLTGSTSPFEAAVRLLAALVAAMVVEGVLRFLFTARAEPSPARGDGPARPGSAPGVPRQRSASAQPLPEPLAERLDTPGG
ncbi:hypothetical protein [Pseudokineococcus sp. 1T1Z-3]|uniref:hypothetical protein n=1 Tax=Pseudokineococcus sp. 1T1Z-3 TaxID=3132745 RepID=UPI0030A69614